MSRTRQQYQKHFIEVTSIALRDGGFTTHFEIEHHAGTHIDVTHFESGQRFATDDESISAGIALAQHKVDIGYDIGTPVNQ